MKQPGTSIVGVAWTFITMSRVFSANVALLYSWHWGTLDPTGEDLHDRCSVAISKSIMTIDVP